MKLREVGYLLGFRPPARAYGREIRRFELPSDGTVEYAQWLHPDETAKEIRQEAVDFLRTFIRPGDNAIDIGAHTGDSTVPIALAAGPGGTVLALEPNSFVFPVLQENARLNGGKTARIEPLNFAAVDRAGEYVFEYSDAGYCNGGRHEGVSRWRHGHAFPLRVRGENLTDYIRVHYPDLVRRLRYVKVDAEGYDLRVLRAIEPLIDAAKPYVCAEVYKLLPLADRASLFGFFVTKRYRVYRMGAFERGAEITRADEMSHGHLDIFAEPS